MGDDYGADLCLLLVGFLLGGFGFRLGPDGEGRDGDGDGDEDAYQHAEKRNDSLLRRVFLHNKIDEVSSVYQFPTRQCITEISRHIRH